MPYNHHGKYHSVNPYMVENDYPIKQISEEIHKEGHTGRYRKSVMRRYGKYAFDENGNIKQRILNEDRKSSNAHIRKMAVLAETYHRINVGRKSFKI